MRVGCAAYSYRQYLQSGDMTLLDFIATADEMGLDGVELTAYYFQNTSDKYLWELKRAAFSRGLDIPAAAVGNNFCLPEKRKRAGQVELVNQWVDIAAKLGAPCLRVFAGSVPDGHTGAEALNWTVASLKQCASHAAQKGVILALENHGGITATAEQVMSILKGVGSEWLRLNLDLANYRTDTYEEIKRTAPYAVTAHAKTHFARPEGEEELDYARIVEILRQAGYNGYLSIEYEGKEDPKTAVPRFAARLKRLVRGD